MTLDMSKSEARKVLGIRDEKGDAVQLKNRSREALIDTIGLINSQETDRNLAHQAAMGVMEGRLKSARKAKSLANARADRAESMMRTMLDKFHEGGDT